MKLFQNPIFVGGLALVAALLVFRSSILPLLKRNARPKSQPAQAATNPSAAVAEKKTDALSAATPARPATANAGKVEPKKRMDLSQVGWNLNGSPPNDPFQLSGSLMQRLTPPASEVLRLSAIWRQTGQSLAVINGRILNVGDSIEGFRIARIESNTVWVLGPAGRESLEFNLAPSRTNTGPRSATAPVTPGATASQ